MRSANKVVSQAKRVRAAVQVGIKQAGKNGRVLWLGMLRALAARQGGSARRTIAMVYLHFHSSSTHFPSFQQINFTSSMIDSAIGIHLATTPSCDTSPHNTKFRHDINTTSHLDHTIKSYSVINNPHIHALFDSSPIDSSIGLHAATTTPYTTCQETTLKHVGNTPHATNTNAKHNLEHAIESYKISPLQEYLQSINLLHILPAHEQVSVNATTSTSCKTNFPDANAKHVGFPPCITDIPRNDLKSQAPHANRQSTTHLPRGLPGTI